MLCTYVETCKNYGRKGAKFAYVVCLKIHEKNVMKEIQCVSSRKAKNKNLTKYKEDFQQLQVRSIET